MPIRPRQTLPTSLRNISIQVTDDGSRTLIQNDTQDAYHSAAGARAETEHVYFNNSGIAERIADRLAVTVLEVGLGTGMSLLVTADAAVGAGSELHYVALENDWVPADVLRQLQPETWIANRQLAESLVAFRQQLPSRVDDGTYQWIAGDKQKVTIHVGDALTHPYDAELTFDAIYFDPFSPASNPNLWKADLLARLARVLKPSGRLVTYCVSRQVRERLTEVGFEIRRVPGPPGGKREVLIASLRRHD